MTLEQVEERASEIDSLLNAEDTSELNLEELRSEAIALKDRHEELVQERNQLIEEITEERTEEEILPIEKGEEKRMERTLKDVLQSEEYINAYARYIKSNDATEVRKLLTELADPDNGDNVVPVPTYLEPRINTAWENERLIARVNKSYIKGIIRQGIEVSATDAAWHEEGDTAPDEEQIIIGVVTIVPESVKKWITISDEVLDMQGRAFLDYIFDEIEYKLAKAVSEKIVETLVAMPTSYVADASGKYTSAIVKTMAGEVAPNTFILAQALLSDEARNPAIVMNKQTIAAFKSLMTTDGYLVANPFDGIPVIASSALDSYEAADSGDVFAIIGDFSAIRMNMPNGQGVQFKYDDLSLAEKDLVKIVGRLPVGLGVVASDRFVLITKGTASA